MKLRFLSFTCCAMLITAGALFTGCTNTDQPGTSVGYHDTFADVAGLTPGQTYTFSINSTGSGSSISGVSSYASGTVRVFWTRGANDSSKITATANPGTSGSGIVWAATTGASMIRLYETADNNAAQPSGLVLGTPGSTTVMPHSASLSGAEKDNIDLVLATDNSITFPNLSLISAKGYGLISGNTRDADFSLPSAIKGGLVAQKFSSGDLKATIGNNPPNFVSLDRTATSISDSSSYVVTVHMLADDHWARVEIVPQAAVTIVNNISGHYLWGDTDPGQPDTKRFIDVNVTYNPTAGQAYAANPVLRKRALLAYTGIGLGGFIR